MIFWLTLFIISGSAMIALIAFKIIQEYFGLLLFWPNQRVVIEKSLARKKKKIDGFILRLNAQTFYIFLHHVLTYIRKQFSKIQAWLDRKSVRLANLITGKQQLKSSGKASHFLYDIRSFKDRFRRH